MYRINNINSINSINHMNNINRINYIYSFIVLAILLLTSNISICLAQTDYKARGVDSSGKGVVIVSKNAANVTSAKAAALADSDCSTCTQIVDTERLDPAEASKKGYATQTTVASILTDTDLLTQEVSDTTNSSTATLTGGSTFAPSYVSLAGFEAISISDRSDQDSASNGLVVSWSDDGTNALFTQSFTVTASGKFSEIFPRRALYYKVAYTNGGVNQTSFAQIVRKLPRMPLSPTTNLPLSIVGTVTTNNQASASTTGVSLFFNAAISNTAVSVKSSGGNLYGFDILNTNASIVYVQVFNVASGSVTVGTTTPVKVIPLTASEEKHISFSIPESYSTAISIAATTGATNGTAPGSAIVVNMDYK